MKSQKSRITLLFFGLLVASTSLVGCGVPHKEVERRTAEAYRKGYGEGVSDERARCNAEVEQLKENHREEVSGLETKILGLKTITVTAIGVSGIVLTGGLISVAVILYRRRKRASETDPFDVWSYGKPPPSVTQEPMSE